MFALFQNDDLEAGLGKLFGSDRATRTAADDDHVRRLVEAWLRLLDRKLDDEEGTYAKELAKLQVRFAT